MITVQAITARHSSTQPGTEILIISPCSPRLCIPAWRIQRRRQNEAICARRLRAMAPEPTARNRQGANGSVRRRHGAHHEWGVLRCVSRAWMAGIYHDADYIRMILGCGRTAVPCQFRGTLRLCVRIEGIAAVQRTYGFLRNLDGTPSLVSKRPEKYRQVSRRRVCAWMAVCKTVGLAYVGSNPTPATQNPRSDPVPVFPDAGSDACPGAVRQTVPGGCGPVVG